MFPYVPQPVLRLGPFTWYAFPVLVILAMAAGFWMVVWRTERFGFARGAAARLCIWILCCSFVGAHIVKIALPDPSRVLAHPEALLAPWRGIASFGGLLGGLLGGLGWMRAKGVSWRQAGQWLDIFAYVFPFAWIPGRLGCTLAHDHLGRLTGSWLAVRYPAGPRYNLGLVELLFITLLAGLFLVLDRRKRPVGLYFALLGVLYGIFRVGLDTLHVNPPRLAGITLDQIGGAATTLVGMAGWLLMSRSGNGSEINKFTKPALPSPNR